MITPIELPNRRTQAELFGSAEKSFDSKFKLLTKARHSILISTFTIKADVFYSPDEVARNLANILIEKHRSGLEVKVFTDYWGNVPSTRKEIKRMLSAGVDVRYFAHHTNVFELAKISWNGLLKINLEKLYHGKTLVVDGWHSCTGGYNWMSGETKSSQLWRDTDLCLSGPISRQVSEDFYKFFNRLNRLVPGNTQPETQYLYPPCQPSTTNVFP